MRAANSRAERKSWRKSTREPTKPVAGNFGERGRSRRSLLFQVTLAVTLAVALLVTLAVILLRESDEDVPLIVAAVSKSSGWSVKNPDPLFAPPNPFAQEDVELFKAWFKKGNDQHVVFEEDSRQIGSMEVASQTDQSDRSKQSKLIGTLVFGLANAVPGGPNGDMIAMFVTAHGLVQNGQPYLLVGNSRPDDLKSWVPVETLLGELKRELQSNERLTDCRIVLFLDASRSGAIWDWGKLDHSFANECREVAQQASYNRIAVIVSSGASERSWWDPRLGESLFAKSIVQTLTGSGDGDKNGTITVGEIAEFLGAQVSQHARAIWSASQHPELLTKKAADWPFIKTPKPVDPPRSEHLDMEKLGQTFAKIDKLWEDHNRLRSIPHPPEVTDPLMWSVLEKQLARLDQLALAGKSYRQEQVQIVGSCQSIIEGMQRGSPLIPDQRDLPELRLIDFFHGERKPSADANALKVAWWENPMSDVQVPFDTISEIETTRMLWEWLGEKNDFSAASLQAASGLLSRFELTRSTPSDLLETHLIRSLSAPDVEKFIPGTRAKHIILSQRICRNALFTPDVRASFWIRDQAANLNRKRMSLIDALLARRDSRGEEESLKRIDKEFEELGETGKKISEAYRLRDRMLHQIPRIAETLLTDVVAFETDEEQDRSPELIRSATDALKCLAVALRLPDKGKTPTESDLEEIEGRFKTARALLNELRLRLSDRARQAAGPEAIAETGLRQAMALLQGSGVSDAGDRRDLHDRLLVLMENSATGLGIVDDPQRQDVSGDGEDHSIALLDGKHPWVDWLEQTESFTCGKADRGHGTESLDKQGELLRRPISSLQSETYSEARKTVETRNNEGKRLAVVRQEVDRLETKLRSRTFLLTGGDSEVERALSDRFALDVQLFTTDHAARSLQEFWCEAHQGEEPFFADAATRLLNVQPFGPLGSNFDGDDLQSRLSNAMVLVDDPLTLAATPNGELRSGALLTEIQGEKVDFTVAVPGSLLPGQVSLTTMVESQLLAMRPPEMDATFQVPDEIDSSDDVFFVDSYFRGLRRRGGLRILRKGDPQTVTFQLPKYDPPAAFVKRDPSKPERIVLVFDCSGSMNVNRRMTMARREVKAFLGQLKGNASKVALILFGHRYAWKNKPGKKKGTVELVRLNEDDPNSPFMVDEYTDGIVKERKAIKTDDPANHNPNFDVEVSVAMGDLTEDHLARLESALDIARPFGVTPTYQAIDTAYEILGQSAGHIIVLTDGQPLTPGIDRTQKRGLNETYYHSAIEHFKKSSPETLHIISFANRNPQKDLQRAFPGRVQNARNGGELKDVLENSVAKTKVRWVRDQTPAAHVVEFGQYVRIDPWPPAGSRVTRGRPVRPAETYQVRATGSDGQEAETTVKVEGGEVFTLKMQEGQLLHQGFPRKSRVHEELRVKGPREAEFSVLALAPKLSNNQSLTLELVVENTNTSKFTPRPSDIWIDLVAEDGDGLQKENFSISLAEFKPSHGVPVVVCRVTAWPTGAKEVQIDAWMRFGDPVAKREELPLDGADAFSSEAINGATFLVKQSSGRNLQFEITEQHKDGNLRPLRVRFVPLPNRATVRRYEDVSRVERVFSYDKRPDNRKAFVSEKRWITEGASIHASGSIKIDRR